MQLKWQSSLGQTFYTQNKGALGEQMEKIQTIPAALVPSRGHSANVSHFADSQTPGFTHGKGLGATFLSVEHAHLPHKGF